MESNKRIREQYKLETGYTWNANDTSIWMYKDWLENKLAELQNRTCETCKHYRITHDMEIGICKQNNLSWKPNEYCSAYENK